MLKAMKPVFLCILLNENYRLKAELVESKFTQGVTKLRIADRGTCGTREPCGTHIFLQKNEEEVMF